MKWMAKKFKTRHQTGTGSAWREQEGFVFGPLAVHLAIDGWRIDHLLSGHRLPGAFTNRRSAQRMVEKLVPMAAWKKMPKRSWDAKKSKPTRDAIKKMLQSSKAFRWDGTQP